MADAHNLLNNDLQLGGSAAIADDDMQRSRDAAYAAGHQVAPTADYSGGNVYGALSNHSREGSEDALSKMWDRANGVHTASDATLNKGNAQATGIQRAIISGGRGAGAIAGAHQQAAGVTSYMNTNNANNIKQVDAKDTALAQDQLSQAYTAQRNQDMSQQGVYDARSQYQANLEAQQRGMNDAGQLGYEKQGFGINASRLAGEEALNDAQDADWTQRSNLHEGMAGIAQGNAMMYGGAAANAGGAGAGYIASNSGGSDPGYNYSDPNNGEINKVNPYAEGGRPPTGRLALVGEKGPELFVPDRPGTIIPAGPTAKVLGTESGPRGEEQAEPLPPPAPPMAYVPEGRNFDADAYEREHGIDLDAHERHAGIDADAHERHAGIDLDKHVAYSPDRAVPLPPPMPPPPAPTGPMTPTQYAAQVQAAMRSAPVAQRGPELGMTLGGGALPLQGAIAAAARQGNADRQEREDTQDGAKSLFTRKAAARGDTAIAVGENGRVLRGMTGRQGDYFDPGVASNNLLADNRSQGQIQRAQDRQGVLRVKATSGAEMNDAARKRVFGKNGEWIEAVSAAAKGPAKPMTPRELAMARQAEDMRRSMDAQFAPSSGKAFAGGGQPPVGESSLVGEQGPELFVPSSTYAARVLAAKEKFLRQQLKKAHEDRASYDSEDQVADTAERLGVQGDVTFAPPPPEERVLEHLDREQSEQVDPEGHTVHYDDDPREASYASKVRGLMGSPSAGPLASGYVPLPSKAPEAGSAEGRKKYANSVWGPKGTAEKTPKYRLESDIVAENKKQDDAIAKAMADKAAAPKAPPMAGIGKKGESDIPEGMVVGPNGGLMPAPKADAPDASESEAVDPATVVGGPARQATDVSVGDERDAQPGRAGAAPEQDFNQSYTSTTPAHLEDLIGKENWALLSDAQKAQKEAAFDIHLRNAAQVQKDINVAERQSMDADIRSSIAQDYQDTVDNRGKDLDSKWNALQEDAKHLANYHEDSNRFYNSRTTGQKIAGLVGVILGGFSQGLRGGQNAALEQINRAQDKDIDDQRAAYNANKDSVAVKRSTYGMAMERYDHDDAKATMALRLAGQDRLVAQAKLEAAQHRGTEVDDRLANFLGIQAEERAKYGIQYTKHHEAQTIQHGQSTADEIKDYGKYHDIVMEALHKGEGGTPPLSFPQWRIGRHGGTPAVPNGAVVGAHTLASSKADQPMVSLPGGGEAQARSKEFAADYVQRMEGAAEFEAAIARIAEIRKKGSKLSPSDRAEAESQAVVAKNAFVKGEGFKRTPAQTEFEALDRVVPPHGGQYSMSADRQLQAAAQITKRWRESAQKNYLVPNSTTGGPAASPRPASFEGSK